MLSQLLYNQLLGTIRLSIPVIVIALFNPILLIDWRSRLLICLVYGVIFGYQQYQASKNQRNSLTYKPTGASRAMLEDMVRSCSLDPKQVELRYAFTKDTVAMNILDLVIVDPSLSTMFDEDPEAINLKTVIDTHIRPGLSAQDKECIASIKTTLTPLAQRFIFKHELGHQASRYGVKKIILIGLFFSLSVLTGVTAAVYGAPVLGQGAALLGMIIGGIADLVLSFGSNYFFKYPEERYADLFAARYSSREEILAAADFFESFDAIALTRRSGSVLNYLPQELLSGHPTGTKRAYYLRSIASRQHPN